MTPSERAARAAEVVWTPLGVLGKEGLRAQIIVGDTQLTAETHSWPGSDAYTTFENRINSIVATLSAAPDAGYAAGIEAAATLFREWMPILQQMREGRPISKALHDCEREIRALASPAGGKGEKK